MLWQSIEGIEVGIEIECPKCGHWNSESTSICKGRFWRGPNKGKVCEFARLKKEPNKNYRIEYRQGGKKIRESIGPSKAAAMALLFLKPIAGGLLNAYLPPASEWLQIKFGS